jgi:hypothetical protein
VQLEFTILIDHGVTGIIATLKADDPFHVSGQGVYNAPFALVAPLGANNSRYWHFEKTPF